MSTTDSMFDTFVGAFRQLLASPVEFTLDGDPEADSYDRLVHSLYGPAEGENVSISEYLSRSLELDNLYERGLFHVSELSGGKFSVRVGRVARPEDAERVTHLINRK